MASLGLGLAWIGLLCIAYINHVHEKQLRALPMSIVVFTTLAFFGTAYAHRNHERDLARYAKPVTTRTLAFDAWRDGDWRSLPAARSELRAQREEPFTLQWAGSAAQVTAVLEASRWRAPAPWDASAAFLWLIPSTPIDKLPVVPKLHQGQPPGLTFIQPVDATNRRVLRLWHVADISDGAGTPRPLWTGIVTTEQKRTELGLIASARTTHDVAPDTAKLEASLRSAGPNAAARTQDGRSVLLVW
jgi:undecaprenyl-diphosphatase